METERTLDRSQVENLGGDPLPPPPPDAPETLTRQQPGTERAPAPETRSQRLAADLPVASTGTILRGDGTPLTRDDINAMLVRAVEQFDITPDEIASVMQKYFMHDILDYRRERDAPRTMPVQVAA